VREVRACFQRRGVQSNETWKMKRYDYVIVPLTSNSAASLDEPLASEAAAPYLLTLISPSSRFDHRSTYILFVTSIFDEFLSDGILLSL
jgi:hypothetical protein